jgi:uncharacterized protein
MAGKFEIDRATDGTYYFHLKAENGKNILASETYVAKSGAEKGIESVKVNASLDERYERRHDVNGRPYFVLKAANDQVIGKSQMYSSPADIEVGIQSVKVNGPSAVVADLTRAKSD